MDITQYSDENEFILENAMELKIAHMMLQAVYKKYDIDIESWDEFVNSAYQNVLEIEGS